MNHSRIERFLSLMLLNTQDLLIAQLIEVEEINAVYKLILSVAAAHIVIMCGLYAYI